MKVDYANITKKTAKNEKKLTFWNGLVIAGKKQKLPEVSKLQKSTSLNKVNYEEQSEKLLPTRAEKCAVFLFW